MIAWAHVDQRVNWDQWDPKATLATPADPAQQVGRDLWVTWVPEAGLVPREEIACQEKEDWREKRETQVFPDVVDLTAIPVLWGLRASADPRVLLRCMHRPESRALQGHQDVVVQRVRSASPVTGERKATGELRYLDSLDREDLLAIWVILERQENREEWVQSAIKAMALRDVTPAHRESRVREASLETMANPVSRESMDDLGQTGTVASLACPGHLA